MKTKLLIALLFLSSFGYAQRAGIFGETLSASGIGTGTINAVFSGSSSYTLVYTTTGTPGAVSIQLEGSTDGTTFAICGSAVTSTTAGTGSCSGTFNKVRANLTSLTGGTAPTVSYSIAASYGTSGGTGTSASQVQGTAANGAATVGNPVLIGGSDGTNVRSIKTDSVGGITPSSNAVALTDTLSNSPPVIVLTNSGSPTAGISYGFVFNGASWDRMRGNTTGVAIVSGANSLADGVSNSTSVLNTNGGATLYTPGQLLVFNGATWDRQRTASLTNFPVATTLTVRNSIGTQLSEKGSRWSVVSNPGGSLQATASIAAEASVRHVVDCISFSAGALTAPVATFLSINVRDGATGAGTVIWTAGATITATTGTLLTPTSICGLNLVGTTNTAMTLEFSALLTNLIETVTITGFNVN